MPEQYITFHMKTSLTKSSPNSKQDSCARYFSSCGFQLPTKEYEDKTFWAIAYMANAALKGLSEMDHLDFSQARGGVGDFGCIVEFHPNGLNQPSYRFFAGSNVGQPANWAEQKLAWLKTSGLLYTSPM